MLGKQFGDDQFTWLMQWAYCVIRKAKEDTVRLNPVEISLRGTFAKFLSHHTHINEEVFWCFGSSLEMTNSLG